MDHKQVQKMIRTLEAELKDLDVQRTTVLDALASLHRLLPPSAANGASSAVTPKEAETPSQFPGLTAGILSVIEEGKGRPVPVGEVREAFRRNGWLITDKGQDRSKTIYETLRRLRVAGRVRKMGKRGYVLPDREPPSDPRIGNLLAGIRQAQGGGS